MLDKMRFWKKDDDFSLPSQEPPSYDLGNPQRMEEHPDPFASPHESEQKDTFGHDIFSQQQYPTPQNYPQASPFPGNTPRSVPQEQFIEQQHSSVGQRDIELLLAKLDAIKSELDALHQRVRKIEQLVETPPTQQKKYW